jgi:hypothetical protein
MANAYAQRTLHRPTSKRFASGPQTFLTSSELNPNGKATQATIIEIAVKEIQTFIEKFHFNEFEAFIKPFDQNVKR